MIEQLLEFCFNFCCIVSVIFQLYYSWNNVLIDLSYFWWIIHCCACCLVFFRFGLQHLVHITHTHIYIWWKISDVTMYTFTDYYQHISISSPTEAPVETVQFWSGWFSASAPSEAGIQLKTWNNITDAQIDLKKSVCHINSRYRINHQQMTMGSWTNQPFAKSALSISAP